MTKCFRSPNYSSTDFRLPEPLESSLAKDLLPQVSSSFDSASPRPAAVAGPAGALGTPSAALVHFPEVVGTNCLYCPIVVDSTVVYPTAPPLRGPAKAAEPLAAAGPSCEEQPPLGGKRVVCVCRLLPGSVCAIACFFPKEPADRSVSVTIFVHCSYQCLTRWVYRMVGRMH